MTPGTPIYYKALSESQISCHNLLFTQDIFKMLG